MGGELLLFEYFGGHNFHVYIIGSNASEIRYPVDRFSPGIVTIGDAGWRFLIPRADGDAIFDEINPPVAFVERCGFALPMQIQYVLSNGKKFAGSYDSQLSRFTGFSLMFEILGEANMVGVRKFLFTFDGTSNVLISAFDSELNEIVFPGTPLSKDANGSFHFVGKCFQIKVQAKHMFDDSYVVDILDDFMGLSEVWENFQCINVYSGSCRWRLLARKRDDNNCCRIVDGWQKMRDCLGLEIGDICVFQCPIRSFDQFRIRVLKFDA